MISTYPILQRTLAACAVAGVVVACSFFAVPAQAEDGAPTGFPSWSDVENSKHDAAATAAQVSNISRLLDTLESQSGVLGDAAVQAGAEYATTQQELDTVTAQVAILDAQAQRANAQAEQYKREAVTVAVQSYKNGGANFGVITTIADLESAKSLNGVDLLQKIGERAAIKAALAGESQAAAAQLQKTRETALAARKELSEKAGESRDAAVAAQSALNQQIQSQQGQSNTLVAQLAFLNGTTEAKEREYRIGQAALVGYGQVQEAKLKATAEAQRAAAGDAANPGPQALPNSVGNPAPSAKPFPDPAPAPKPAPAPAPKPAPAPAPVPSPEPPPPAPAPPLVPTIPGGVANDPAGAKGYAGGALGSFGWGQDQFQCLNSLWERESGWRTNATNPYSGAYGIAQAYPASRYEMAGSDWLTNYRTQVNWGLGYIKGRYGSPCGAWEHSETVGWY